jgi:hypothetical protein
MIKELISRLTMIKTSKAPMYDSIACENIYYWQDYYFDIYMAHSKWGIRLKIN